LQEVADAPAWKRFGNRTALWPELRGNPARLVRHTRDLPRVRLKTITVGYLRTYGRAQERHGKAHSRLPSTALETQLVEDVRATLFEALNWLDACGTGRRRARDAAPAVLD